MDQNSLFNSLIQSIRSGIVPKKPVDMEPEVFNYSDPTMPPLKAEEIDMEPEVISKPRADKKTTAVLRSKSAESPHDATKIAPNNPTTNPQSDPIEEQLNKRRTGLQDERKALLKQADDATKMTDDEKIAYALLGALPALVGTLGGAAIAGGYGAAAGAAGGLQGAAEGVASIAGEKKAARKEALARAEKLAEQEGHVEDLGAANQQRLAQQSFHAGEAEKERGARASLAEKEQTFKTKQAAQEHRYKLGEIDASSNAQKDIARIHEAGDYMKALLAGRSGAGAKLADADKSFYTNAESAMQNLEELKTIVKENGNWSPTQSPFSDPKTAGKLNQMLYDTAVAYAKIVDPASAAREGEVEAVLNKALPAGALVSRDTTLQALENMQRLIAEKATSRAQLGVPVGPNVEAFGRGNKAPNGSTNNGKLKDILGF